MCARCFAREAAWGELRRKPPAIQGRPIQELDRHATNTRRAGFHPVTSKTTQASERQQTVKAQVKLARSAGVLTESAREQTDSADRRTVLAADRTVLAAERTYAAWVRTGLAALASGIGARALLEKMLPDWLIFTTGSVLILFGSFCFVAGVWRELRPGAPPPSPDTRRIPAWLLILVNGFLFLVSCAALPGLWLNR